MRLIWIACVVVLAAVGPFWAQCSQVDPAKPSAASITLRAERDSATAGEPIWVEATLTNKSDHQISVWREKSGSYRVFVKGRDGESAADKRSGFRNGRPDPEAVPPPNLNGSGACVSVAARGKLTERIDVARLYDLSQPGQYTITVERGDPESGESLQSPPVTVSVKRRP